MSAEFGVPGSQVRIFDTHLEVGNRALVLSKPGGTETPRTSPLRPRAPARWHRPGGGEAVPEQPPAAGAGGVAATSRALPCPPAPGFWAGLSSALGTAAVGIIFALGTPLIIYCSSPSRGAFSHELSAARFFSPKNKPQNAPRV